VKGETFLRII